MKSYSIQRLVTFSICLVCAGAFGCKSSGRSEQSEQAVEGMQQTSTKLEQAKKEVNDALAALDQLSATSDQKAFDNYRKQVADLKAAGDKASARWKSMRDKQRQWTAQWESESETITNPDVKKSMEERRQVVRDGFSKVEASAQDVKNAYQPFLSNLQEIQKALSINLSSATVQSLQPSMAKAKEEGMTLNTKLDALNTEVKDLMKGIAPMMPPKS